MFTFETVNGQTRIYIQNLENVQAVLRAIVKASFEMANPVGMGFMHFNSSTKLSDEAADHFINLDGTPGTPTIEMDYVEGRQCKTLLTKEQGRVYALNNTLYERDRGKPDPMLERAQAILNPQSSGGVC